VLQVVCALLHSRVIRPARRYQRLVAAAWLSVLLLLVLLQAAAKGRAAASVKVWLAALAGGAAVLAAAALLLLAAAAGLSCCCCCCKSSCRPRPAHKSAERLAGQTEAGLVQVCRPACDTCTRTGMLTWRHQTGWSPWAARATQERGGHLFAALKRCWLLQRRHEPRWRARWLVLLLLLQP
jgi:hypothetical protein